MEIACRGSPGSDQAAIGAGPLHGKLVLPRQDADQRVGHGLGRRPADHRRVDAVSRRITLGHDPAVMHHHHGLGPAMRRRRLLLEGAVEGLLQRRIVRFDDAGPRDRGQHAGRGRRADNVLGRRRRVVQHQAAQRAAIGGPALHQAGEACRHFGMLAIDAMADQEADRRQARRNGLPVELLGLDLGDESGRTELVADETGGDARRAIETAAA